MDIVVSNITDSVKAKYSQVAQAVGLEEKPPPPTCMEQCCDFFKQEADNALEDYCPSLTWTQRIWGFIIAFCAGWVLSVVSCFFLLIPRTFAILYTFGNVCSLLSTGFIFGFCNQLKSMCAPVRIVATFVYLAAMALTLYAGLALQNTLLTIVMVVVQACALFWWTLSYIPFGRSLFQTCLLGCCNFCEI
eukprot:gnl/Spiro4/22675_TR11188_c0_g1_i1.p1 gnl/Spiro4/22675_TR11188_c0_g1~~gnl/Spiro4/22675_TR11188_c0_g1_i1.p1  ORF type:complete len:211 (+),score=73.52 gnl/Spiro4/22675_TR11188_c0_g1_i1:66-635(+)